MDAPQPRIPGLRRCALCLLVLLLTLPQAALAGWFPDNSLSLRGLSLKAFDPPASKGWAMVLPLPMMVPGKQTVDIIAGNCRVVGQLEITAGRGRIHVISRYAKGLLVHEEMLLLGARPSDFEGLDQGLLAAYPLGAEIKLDDALRDAPLLYLCLAGRVSFQDGMPGVQPYGAKTRANIKSRLALADRFGLRAVYTEQLPPAASIAKPGEPDENGCIDGVCPVPLPFPKP